MVLALVLALALALAKILAMALTTISSHRAIVRVVGEIVPVPVPDEALQKGALAKSSMVRAVVRMNATSNAML
jgi:hypothetical protein